MEENYINKSVTVGTTAVEILPEVTNTGQRLSFILTNTSTGGQNITISFHDNAVAGAGIVIAPLGATYEVIDPAFKPTNRRISAIASAAGGTLSVSARIAGV